MSEEKKTRKALVDSMGKSLAIMVLATVTGAITGIQILFFAGVVGALASLGIMFTLDTDE